MATDFLTLSEAASHLNIHRRTLGRRLDEFGTPIFADPANRRTRLIRVEDVKQLEVPRLIERKTREPQSAA